MIVVGVGATEFELQRKESKSQNTKYIKNLAILTSFTLLAMMMMGGIIFVIIIIADDVKSQ